MSTQSRTRLLAALAVAALAVSATEARQAKPSSINIPFEQYTMPNGLRVILSQDRSTPTVAVNLWYHVGSKNEEAGRTGFAHLFEHVMFTGSGNVPYGLHDKFTSGVGGNNNGTTDNDRTLYYETIPSNYLETALWLEADRMGFLLDSLDIAKLNAQRDIVKNERRQRIDNQPYGRVGEILSVGDVPEGASVLVVGDRQHGGSFRRLGRGREELLPPLLRAEQRDSDGRRGLRSGTDQQMDHEVFRQHPARQADHPSQNRAGHADRGETAGL